MGGWDESSLKKQHRGASVLLVTVVAVFFVFLYMSMCGVRGPGKIDPAPGSSSSRLARKVPKKVCSEEGGLRICCTTDPNADELCRFERY